jgi:uncharacterized protein (TIGR03083 family)
LATPSLCAEWSVREVITHTAWHIHLRTIPVLPVSEMLPYLRLGSEGYDARLMAQHTADRPDEIAAWLSSSARYNSPNLGELIIHQQDVRRALGIRRAVPDEQVLWLLGYMMTSIGNVQAGGKPRDRITGLRVTATALDWTSGDGPEVTGPGETILLAAARRAVALEELSGPGVAVLAEGMER